jgi:hypothetical protein
MSIRGMSISLAQETEVTDWRVMIIEEVTVMKICSLSEEETSEAQRLQYILFNLIFKRMRLIYWRSAHRKPGSAVSNVGFYGSPSY